MAHSSVSLTHASSSGPSPLTPTSSPRACSACSAYCGLVLSQVFSPAESPSPPFDRHSLLPSLRPSPLAPRPSPSPSCRRPLRSGLLPSWAALWPSWSRRRPSSRALLRKKVCGQSCLVQTIGAPGTGNQLRRRHSAQSNDGSPNVKGSIANRVSSAACSSTWLAPNPGAQAGEVLAAQAPSITHGVTCPFAISLARLRSPSHGPGPGRCAPKGARCVTTSSLHPSAA